ncbi:MAG: preprotein translocase subunit SecG [Flavobacteriales bacterium]
MTTFITVLIMLISIILILVILIQKSKGGGLSATFAGSNQMLGVRKTTDFLEKTTWSLAIALCALSLISSIFIHSNTEEVQGSEIQDLINQAPIAPPSGMPDNAPSPLTPATNPTNNNQGGGK